MKEYYRSKNGVLYHGDFRKIIKNLKFDCVVTDPPFNIDILYDNCNDNVKSNKYIKMISYLKGYPSALVQYPRQTIQYFSKALGLPDEIIPWSYSLNRPRQARLISFYNVGGFKSFDKQISPPKFPKNSYEKLDQKSKKGTELYQWYLEIQLLKNVKDKKGHPCPINSKVFEGMVKLISKKGDTVLDPFFGTGTLAGVCEKLGRKWIGIDLSEKYCKVAVKFLENNCLHFKK